MNSEKERLLNDDGLKSKSKTEYIRAEGEPTSAFIGASWGALVIGVGAYLIGLFNAGMELNEKGYYFALLVLGLYSAISLQKAVRDKSEGIDVTSIYYGVSWLALVTALALMAIGLFNAGSIILSEKGFYAMAYVLSLYSVVAIQKNIRDTKRSREISNLK